MTEVLPWALTLLGPPALHGPGGVTVRPERKTAALLAYLSLEGPTSRARLVHLLWPGTPGSSARNNLVHLLRRLARHAQPGLITGQETLSLHEALPVDARDALRPDAPVPPGELLAGVALDDLPDLDDWLGAQRGTLDALRLARLTAAAQRAEHAGDLPGALRAALAWLDLDPLSGEAARQVMRLHYLSGDRPAALAVFTRVREQLRRELNLPPDTATLALAGQIRRGEPLPGQAPAAGALPLGVLRPPVLVGREAAWAHLESAWAARRTIYLTGEAGVGKTRLAQEFAASKGRALFLPGRAGAQDVPFAAATHNARARLAANPGVPLPDWVRRELSRLLPELWAGPPPPPIQSEAARLQYYLAHLELVRLTAPGYAAVITDDVQYYDPATVELGTFFLTQAPAGDPGEVPRHLITYRRGSLSAHAQARIDGLVQAGLAARVDLDGLDLAGTHALLSSLDAPPELAGALHARTGGNLQFLLEALRAAFQGGQFTPDPVAPVGLDRLLAGRLARLSPGAAQVARGAAALGDQFTLELLSEVLGLTLPDLADAWEELERAQIMVGEAFSHDLLREAVLADLPDAARGPLHRACARTLARHGAHPERVARHWQAAGDAAQAAGWWRRAAAHAEAAGRPDEARAAARLAAQLEGPPAPDLP
ncbi:AAA family ATPase [Deinococcus radiotolerans]|uniref:Bacterial transcriptional activator domain-containing protein n=1 Tax=Deinococcus radiotolerans TaxID=1309407 RepID=A0ABQ2FIN3_9DEIO|nr:AAA family ATPase [Deinococcus radiotolerans]GGK95725.1 hypothetical protein GCM10010844_12760 [Deinococcus radiotolerans]